MVGDLSKQSFATGTGEGAGIPNYNLVLIMMFYVLPQKKHVQQDCIKKHPTRFRGMGCVFRAPTSYKWSYNL